MPERPLTIAYAAGAGLAAIALVYVFQPTFFIDGESGGTSASSRKRGIVGLSNPANDCFINSVLQALAGLGDLRLYLIRETHRRKLEGPQVYRHIEEDPARKDVPLWKLEGLQEGLTSFGLKDILDALNERPIYRKTISAASFVTVLEQAFKQRISRQQQDAQEFLQVVAERLCDEYHAGQRARDSARARASLLDGTSLNHSSTNGASIDEFEGGDGARSQPVLKVSNETETTNGLREGTESLGNQDKDGIQVTDEAQEDGFPLEGGSAQQIECLTCKYQPKATETTFCTLSLSVPQVSSTTLNACFDDMFKTEYIEDFKCDKCRLMHALEQFKQELASSNSERFKAKTQAAVDKVEHAIKTDPEKELKDVDLPDTKFAPKRKIAKHIRITKFPKVLAIHLSRSIHNIGQSTMKNSAKVAFPERLRLGGLLDHKMYHLVSVVCHKGSHHSGHYESFRRQHLAPPFSTPNTFFPAGAYSKPLTPNPSQISTPLQKPDDPNDTSTISSSPELLSPNSTSSTSLPISANNSTSTITSPTKAPRDNDTSSIRSFARSAKSTLSKVPSIHRTTASPLSKEIGGTNNVSNIVNGKRKKVSSRWWRISDDKIKECKTSDVLGMQKEVYMLFYELEKDESNL